MSVSFVPERLDVAAFARAQAELRGDLAPARLERLVQECAPGSQPATPVRWTAQGEQRTGAGGQSQAWLRLQASADLPLTCQRCLQAVTVPLSVDRWFRFVADEAAAMAEDDASEEDLLVLSRRFDLIELVEDELLMAVPLVPMHEPCPTELPRPAAGIGPEESEKPHPFAALARLKR